MKTTTIYLSLITAFLFSGNAMAQKNSTTPTTSTTQPKTPAAKNNQTALQNTVLEFKPGMSALSPTDQEKLMTLVKGALAKGKIANIEVAVWSDKMLPTKGDLTKGDRILAAARAKHIQEALKKDLGHTRQVRIYNMAQGSHWLARTFHTAEAELDSAFAKRGTQGIKRDDFKIIKEAGGPSKAVIVISVKE